MSRCIFLRAKRLFALDFDINFALLKKIREKVKCVEFPGLNFDGCSSVRSNLVIGFIVKYLDDEWAMKTRVIGNFRVLRVHSASDISELIAKGVQVRLGGMNPSYFVFGSAPNNKDAFPKFVLIDGRCFQELTTSNESILEWDDLDQSDVLNEVSLL